MREVLPKCAKLQSLTIEVGNELVSGYAPRTLKQVREVVGGRVRMEMQKTRLPDGVGVDVGG